MRIRSLGLSALLALSCQRGQKTEPSAGAAASVSGGAARPRVVVSEPLSAASSFELVASADALHLVWAVARPGPGWMSEGELSHDGTFRSPPRVLPLPSRALGKVTDLAATYVGDKLTLAWLSQGAKEARAEAVMLGGAPASLLDLGPAALVAESARGNIEIAPELPQERALVMWRGLEAPCVDPAATACVGFAFRRLREAVAESTGLPLSVPVPCASHAVELAVSPGRFHYGVCTREGTTPLTTMFTIQYEPEYARAEPLLRGCVPLGTIEAGGRPWLVGDCHGKRKVVPVPFADEAVTPESIDEPEIACTPERAELRKGRFVLSLRAPQADLQSVLPASFLPTGARAGWTGKSLVVAYLAGGALETRSFVCRAGRLAAL